MVSLMDRTPLSNWGSGCNDDQLVILRKFLTAEALTAPKFNEVKSAIAEIESYAERRALNAAAICDLINKIPTAEASGAVGQRYFEVALKNGFEQSMEMPPLTLDEIGELENGGVRGSWWTEDTDKYVASLGHDWKLLYYWFRTQVIEKMAEAAYTRSNAPNKTFKQSTEDVLAEFGARSPCIVPVSTGHGGMPRDELHPSGRVILDIYTAARAYMIGLGNTAGETMSHIFELRPYDASVAAARAAWRALTCADAAASALATTPRRCDGTRLSWAMSRKLEEDVGRSCAADIGSRQGGVAVRCPAGT